ncbi:uncharacterized protein LOC129239163 [Anastrepha obliqua]|uniref:uncharacterized protein LOC129239163 n=1 Tax=Anastrepha obliqua TaxID=95512 RepID=UPI0024098B40|nr:uncharacterized protein LOC129239163 [Anastrepha obliqua]
MNIARILGHNNKIYQKFGDYCITEAEPNQCCIVCCFCQEEHHSEETFWAHIKRVHDYTPTSLRVMLEEKPVIANCMRDDSESRDTTPSCHSGKLTLATSKTNVVQPVASDTPMYVEAEYLEGVVLNDPNTLLELTDITSTFLDFKEKTPCDTQSATPKGNQEKENVQKIVNNQLNSEIQSSRVNGTAKDLIDIDSLTPKQLLENGKLLKRLFQQMQHVNNEFKYKLNKLTQTVKLIECELKKEPGSRTLKRYMKIIPDQPFTSRDEVLILDDELHHSKEMRDALHEETLALPIDNVDSFCRILWRFIMTDEVSNQFCWRGVVNADKVTKYPIKDMTILDVFQGVFRERYPELPFNFFKDRTMIYFNKAHERLKRKQLNKVDAACNVDSNDCEVKEQERFKQARNDAETNDDGVDAVFQEVFCR